MNKEQAKNLEIGDKLVNINTYSVGELTNIGNSSSYCYRIYEENECNSDWWNDLDNWYTKDQLKEIKVTPLQAVSLLQTDFFNIRDSFISCSGDKIIKQKDGIQIILNQKYDDVLLSSNNKDMIFEPYIKPFTKQDLKSGMIVINSNNGIGHIILNSIKGDIIQYNCGRIDNLSDYDDNLVKNCDNTEINKIYKLKDSYSFNNYDFNDKIRYELLWSRG